MSRSKQETLLLDERIEKIRKKNEEIEKRHLEVEADKQNAAKLNAIVQITSPSEDWTIGGRRSNEEAVNTRPLDTDKPLQSRSGIHSSAKCYTFREGDGPPPDPKYKFLADSERDFDKSISDNRQLKSYKGRNDGHFGGGVYTRNRQNRGGLQQTKSRNESLETNYEAWRAERNRIDSDRISRQKTAEGHWRREWDNEKMVQEESVRPVTRVSRSSGSHRSSNRNVSHDSSQHTGYGYDMQEEIPLSTCLQIRNRGGRVSDTHRRSRGNMQRHEIIGQPILATGKLTSSEEQEVHNEQSVLSAVESITVSVPNDSLTPAVRRVKVNAPIVGGTGRVGPRQRIRVSYSSQSEDEGQQKQMKSGRNSTTKDLCSNLNDSDTSSKPPLPPSKGQKAETPKPRRQQAKKSGLDLNQKRVAVKKSEIIKGDNRENKGMTKGCQKGDESGGDDSWEDVTTTSGNESASEELQPLSKSEIFGTGSGDGSADRNVCSTSGFHETSTDHLISYEKDNDNIKKSEVSIDEKSINFSVTTGDMKLEETTNTYENDNRRFASELCIESESCTKDSVHLLAGGDTVVNLLAGSDAAIHLVAVGDTAIHLVAGGDTAEGVNEDSNKEENSGNLGMDKNTQ